VTRLGEVEWKLLADTIRERFGLTFDGGRRELLEARLRNRLDALHLHSFAEYYHYLRFHPGRDAEFGQLASQVTNNETYFFREAHQFDLLARHVVPRLAPALRGRPLRVLSAGCSSGEEPYSIVIALQNAGLELRGITWEIDAFDLSPDRIARGRAGIYEASSLRACDQAGRKRYFSPTGDRYRLKERHRKGVSFHETNLLAREPEFIRERYDAIFCRNLLIYFHAEAFDALITRFDRWLAPGGYLFLGHSESLADRATPFAAVCLDQRVVYQKAAS
jgi:chemotaxis protein methyltransferase CheR